MRGLWVLGVLSIVPLAAPLTAWADGGHDMAGMDMAGMSMEASPTVKVTVATSGELVPGKPVNLTLMVKDQYGRPLRPADVEVIHDEPMHLFAIDGTLSDYQHLHPVPGANDGEWVVGFTPRKAAYKLWLEVKPKGEDDQFVPLQLGGVVPQPTALGRDDVLTAAAAGMRFTLTLAMPPHAGEGTLAILNVYSDDGLPVTSLEPIMGAYAHLAGFDRNLDTIMHAHPSGAEPDSPDDRGGPVLNFQLMPQVSGMHKLFLQVKHDGAVVTVPFVISVN
jgi:hypothetical protein